MTVFGWRSHDAVVLGCKYTAFTLEVILTSPVPHAILGFVTNILYIKPFKANFPLPFSLTMNSICKTVFFAETFRSFVLLRHFGH